jgi:DeoR family fructose operon transcriptional repressor
VCHEHANLVTESNHSVTDCPYLFDCYRNGHKQASFGASIPLVPTKRNLMYAPERHRAIVEAVARDGRASVVQLSDSLAVAPETIRRDLSVLERQGLVRRVHGGAMPAGRLGFEPSVDSRELALPDEKRRIAEAAIAELPTEGAIILDAGTTTGAMIDLIPDSVELTVVTNSVLHAAALSKHKNINVMMLGGRVRSRTLACVDEWAVQSLRGLYADVAFVGANGITPSRGLTTPDRAEAAIKNAMLMSARRRVVLADNSKFGDDHFASFGKLEDVDVVITDVMVDDDVVDEIEAIGPVVVRS